MGNWANSPVKLVGRNEALIAAEAGLARGGGILLVGPPGVGKTALARALLEARSSAGTEVVVLLAHPSGRDIPFAAFAPVVPHFEGPPEEEPGPFPLLQRIREAVIARAAAKELLLAVDDAHCLDAASALVVFQLVSTGVAKAVLAARAGETFPPPLRSLWKEGLVERIDLEPLEHDDSRELAELVLEGPADDALNETLWETSRGNPLYLRELIRAGRHGGSIFKERDLWRLRGRLAIGPRLYEILDERLNTVAGPLAASLEAIAFGDPMPLAAARHAVPEADLDQLQREGLVVVQQAANGMYVRMSHPLYCELVKERLPETRANSLRQTLAGAFEAAGEMQPTDLLRVASWRVECGAAADPQLLNEAAALAAHRFEWALCAKLAEASIQSGGGTSAKIQLSEALARLGRPAEALAVLGDYAGEGEDERARLAVLRASTSFWGLGDWSSANRILEDSEQSLTDPSERTWVAATRAGFLNFIGRPDVAAKSSRPLLDTPHLAPRARISAGHALSISLAWGGLCDQALRVAEAFRSSGSGLPSSAVDWSLVVRTNAYRVAGRVQETEDLARAEYDLALQMHDREAKAIALGALAWVALVRGELSVSVLRYREAISTYGPIATRESGLSWRHLMCQLVESLAISGDSLGASAVLTETREEMRISERWLLPLLWVSQAWVSVARGEISRAVTELSTATEEAQKGGHVANELVALMARLRLGAAAGASDPVVGRLAQLATWVEGDLVQVMALHANALREGSADALDSVAERYGLLGLGLYAAETAAQASQVHARGGQPRRAAASASRAQSMLAGSDPTRPVTLMLASTPGSLTRREREVALLARSGMSSQAIAARLHLSTRTVDTHLARVYFKLGISRRSELADALGVVEYPAG